MPQLSASQKRLERRYGRPYDEISSIDERVKVTDDDRPSGNAGADEWRAYRTAHGYSASEVADMGRNDLRDLADR